MHVNHLLVASNEVAMQRKRMLLLRNQEAEGIDHQNEGADGMLAAFFSLLKCGFFGGCRSDGAGAGEDPFEGDEKCLWYRENGSDIFQAERIRSREKQE